MIHSIFLLNSSTNNLWVLYTACASHIYNSLLRLQRIKGLKKDEFKLLSVSGESISAEAMGTFLLKLPLKRNLELEECYYMPKIIRNIISVPLLLHDGYEIKFIGNGCSIFHSNEFFSNGYFNNDLLILSLNEKNFHIDGNMKRKREDINISFL